MDGWPDWLEEEGKNVPRFVGSDDDGGTEVLHLKATQKRDLLLCASHVSGLGFCSWCRRVNLKHSFGLFRQGHVVYPHGKAEGVSEEDGSVHWVNGTVSDMEQRGCVVEAQVANRQDGKGALKTTTTTKKKPNNKF